jgi:hypothetical protein
MIELINRIDNTATLPEDPAPIRLQKTLLIFLNAAGLLIVPWGAWYLFYGGMLISAAVALGYSFLSAIALAHLLQSPPDLGVFLLQDMKEMLMSPNMQNVGHGEYASSAITQRRSKI